MALSPFGWLAAAAFLASAAAFVVLVARLRKVAPAPTPPAAPAGPEETRPAEE